MHDEGVPRMQGPVQPPASGPLHRDRLATHTGGMPTLHGVHLACIYGGQVLTCARGREALPRQRCQFCESHRF